MSNQVEVTNMSHNKVSLSVTKSCGCTSARLGSAELEPGASTQLQIKQDTTLKRGEFTETVFLTAGDRPKGEFMVQIKGHATRVIGYQPEKISLGEVRHRTDAVQMIELHSLNGQPLIVNNVTTWTNSVLAEVFDASESQAVLRVSLPANAKTGKIRDYVKVALSSPLERTEVIPVTGFYTGELSAEPAELSLTQLTDERWQDMLLEAKIEQVDGKQFAVKSVSCNDSRFSATIEPCASFSVGNLPNCYLLKVKLVRPVAKAEAQAVVTISGDFATDGELEVPIHIVRQF